MASRGKPTELTRVKENKTIRANEIDTASAGFTAQEEDKLFSIRVVELVYELLSFVDGHSTVQTEIPVSCILKKKLEIASDIGKMTHLLLRKSFSNRSRVCV